MYCVSIEAWLRWMIVVGVSLKAQGSTLEATLSKWDFSCVKMTFSCSVGTEDTSEGRCVLCEAWK